MEAAARARLRSAEARLAGDLAGTVPVINIYGDVHGTLDAYGATQNGEPQADAGTVATESDPDLRDRQDNVQENQLALAALWEVTHSRLDLYHQIATDQARRSFLTAQVAIAAGFALLIAFSVLAAQTRTTAAAVTTGSLGAVSAALAGYIGRTFVRSQESAAAHLRAYFDQPLEFSKYLAAERLLATTASLDGDRQAAILTTVVQAMVKSDPSGADQN